MNDENKLVVEIVFNQNIIRAELFLFSDESMEMGLLPVHRNENEESQILDFTEVKILKESDIGAGSFGTVKRGRIPIGKSGHIEIAIKSRF